MLNVYKKVEKSKQNPSGFIDVTTEYDLTRPLLLCISAQNNIDKSLYGIVREGAQGARVYTTQENAAGFKLDEMPIDFLGVRWQKDSDYQDNYVEMVDKFILPYITMNGSVTDIDDLKRRASMINFMTYCDGTYTYQGIEETLEQRFLEMGLGNEDINEILSHLSLVAIGTMCDTTSFRAMTTTFIDVNDEEIMTEKTENYQMFLRTNGQKSGLAAAKGKKCNLLYIYEGTGDHTLKEYFKNGRLVKPILSYIIAKFIQQSLSTELKSVDEKVSDIFTEVRKYLDETKKPDELMSELDSNLQYGSATKYTDSEMELRKELDSLYRELAKTTTALENEKKYRANASAQLDTLMNCIRKYSSDTTFYQITNEARVWQAPIGFDFNQPSDRMIREAFENAMANIPDDYSENKHTL